MTNRLLLRLRSNEANADNIFRRLYTGMTWTESFLRDFLKLFFAMRFSKPTTHVFQKIRSVRALNAYLVLVEFGSMLLLSRNAATAPIRPCESRLVDGEKSAAVNGSASDTKFGATFLRLLFEVAANYRSGIFSRSLFMIEVNSFASGDL